MAWLKKLEDQTIKKENNILAIFISLDFSIKSQKLAWAMERVIFTMNLQKISSMNQDPDWANSTGLVK